MVVLKEGTRPPWVGLGGAVWVEIAAGNAHIFPLYSDSLRSVLGFYQQQLAILGVADVIGENVGILPGIACNKFPPWVVLFVGVCTSFLGYGVLWLAVTKTVESLPYWVLLIALYIGAHSSAWFGTAVLVTNMRNFPSSRGTVAGILKGYLGLSASVYTEIYTMILNESNSNLLLFLTLGVPIIVLSSMYFIKPCTPASGEDSSDHGHFLFTQAASISLGVYLLTTTTLTSSLSLGKGIHYAFIAMMVVLSMAPLAIPLKMTLFPENRKKPSDSGNEDDDVSGLADALLKPSSSSTPPESSYELEDTSEVDTLLALGEGAVKRKRKTRRGEDFTFWEAAVKADFWLLWVVNFVGVGSGLTVVNNLAQIGASLGTNDTAVLLSLLSFCNFLGRLVSGAVSEHFVRKKTLPRTFWMTVTQIIMVLCFLMYASALNGTIYAATALLGICFGFQLGIMIPTASELFGLKHFGVIFNFMQAANPAGALLFSGWLAGKVYDSKAAKQRSSSCMGTDCFRLTFLVLAGVCGFGALLSIVLTVRIRPVYQMLYAGGSLRLPQNSGR